MITIHHDCRALNARPRSPGGPRQDDSSERVPSLLACDSLEILVLAQSEWLIICQMGNGAPVTADRMGRQVRQETG